MIIKVFLIYFLRCSIRGARTDETQPLSHSPLSTPGLEIKNLVHTHTHTEPLNTGVCVCACAHVRYSQVHSQATVWAARHEVINTVQLSRGH